MISKLLLKLWFYNKIALNTPISFFFFLSFAIWGMGIRGCFTAADNQSEKNKLKLPLAKFKNALQQVFPSALVVYSLVRDEGQEEQSWNEVDWEDLDILVA